LNREKNLLCCEFSPYSPVPTTNSILLRPLHLEIYFVNWNSLREIIIVSLVRMGSDLIMESTEISSCHQTIKEHAIPCKQQMHQLQLQIPSISNKEAECIVKLKEMIRGKKYFKHPILWLKNNADNLINASMRSYK